MRPLRIGIDIHSVGSHKGGNATYYRELVKELVKVRCDHNFSLYHTHPAAAKQFISDDRFALKRLRPGSRWLRIPFTLPFRAWHDKLDLFHAQFIVPPFLKCKTVTTIPDIAYEHSPEFFPFHQRAWLKVLVRESAHRADHIITVSERSKRDLIELYGISEDKITVTYEGAGNEFVPLERNQAKETVKRRYGISDEYVLYLGRLQGRKNLMRLVQAYATIRKSGFPQKLVLAGKADSLFHPTISLIRELKLESDVLLPGYVEAQDLPSLYNAAEVFVYPSLYEGFGLPVVEAMACGTPVITSRGSSLEEIAGEGALLVDALDERSLSEALMQLLTNPELRTQLSRAGVKRSSDFSFKRAAQQTVGIYERVLGGDNARRSAQSLPLRGSQCV